MRKYMPLLIVAALMLIVAPAWSQQCVQSQDKPACSKEQQAQCAQTCSKDGKACAVTCPGCGQSLTATCSKDGKSCSATCTACNKEITIPCPAGHSAKTPCCAADKAQTAQAAAPAGCATESKSGCAAAACSGQSLRYKNAAIPVMLYDVAGERMGCPKSAVALAAEKNCAVKYVVDGKAYENKAEALNAEVAVLEAYLTDVLSVKYGVGEEMTCCPKTAETLAKKNGKKVCYRLTGYTFKDQGEAEKAAKLARLAAESLNMKIMVGDEAFDCPMKAAEAAKQCGKEVDYCIGTMRTTSESAAKIQLEIEKIKAAVDKIEECCGQKA